MALSKEQILARDLRRVFYLLQMLMYEMEAMAENSVYPLHVKKRFEKYMRNQIGLVLRDLKTSTPNTDSYEELLGDLTGERLRDLHEFIEIGIGVLNLDELIDLLRKEMLSSPLKEPTN